MRIRWECKLCKEKFDSISDALTHLRVEHTFQEQNPSEFIKPIVTLRDITGQWTKDGELYWWPLDEEVENTLEKDGFPTDFAINLVYESNHWMLVLAFIPKKDFTTTDFRKYIEKTIEIVENITNTNIEEFSVRIQGLTGIFGNIGLTKCTGAITYSLKLD